MVQGLHAFLEKHAPVIRRRADPSWALHMCTDSIPADSPLLLDMDNEDLIVENTKGKQNGRIHVNAGGGGIEKAKGKGKGQVDLNNDAALSKSSGAHKTPGRTRSGSLNETPPNAKKNPKP